MKGLVNFVLRNKLAVWLLTIIITASGIYSGTQMKTETIPDISIPYLMVMGVYPGATPEQVMDDVSMPLEKQLRVLKALNRFIQIHIPTWQISKWNMNTEKIWMKQNEL